MRVPQLVTDFFEWRWAPCVGLTAGSLTFVALALLLIPSRIGGEPRVVNALSAYENRSQRAIFGSSLTRSVTEPEDRRAEDARLSRALPPPSPPSRSVTAPIQRGFSPVLERPEPLPAAPLPAPTQPEPPPPAPGTVIVTQPEPGGPAREVTTQ